MSLKLAGAGDKLLVKKSMVDPSTESKKGQPP